MRTFIVAAVMLAGAAGATADDRFAVALYKELRTSGGNVVVSPSNIADALAMIQRGARGETARELAVLLPAHRTAKTSGELVSAGALWTNGTPLLPAFVATVKREFNGAAQTLDFSKPGGAAARINGWANLVTHGRIRSLVTPAQLPKSTRAIVTAAIYMKAPWSLPLDRSETRNRVFHLGDGRDVMTPTMRAERFLDWARVGDVRVVALNYEPRGLTMLIVLPDARNGLAALEQSLTPQLIARWTKAMRRESLELRFPRFRGATASDIVEPLRRLGVTMLFDPKRADLRAMSAAPMFISDVTHAASITVDEEGTEASAATAERGVWTSTEVPPPPKPFIVDHPFLYIIRSGDEILFIGRVVDPRS